MSEKHVISAAGDSVSLGDEAQVIAVLRESAQALWEVVNNLTPAPNEETAVSSDNLRFSEDSEGSLSLRRCS